MNVTIPGRRIIRTILLLVAITLLAKARDVETNPVDWATMVENMFRVFAAAFLLSWREGMDKERKP